MQAVAVREPEPVYLVEPLTPLRSEVIDSVVFLDWGVAEIPLLGTTAAGHPIPELVWYVVLLTVKYLIAPKCLMYV